MSSCESFPSTHASCRLHNPYHTKPLRTQQGVKSLLARETLSSVVPHPLYSGRECGLCCGVSPTGQRCTYGCSSSVAD